MLLKTITQNTPYFTIIVEQDFEREFETSKFLQQLGTNSTTIIPLNFTCFILRV